MASTDSASLAGWLATAWFIWAFSVVWLILAIIGYWKMFTKANEAGWKSIIPIWNTIVWLKIIGRPWWWLLLFLIPVVGWVLIVIALYDTSESYGHGFGFTLGLVFFSSLFFIILGWGSSKYIGPRGVAPAQPAPAYTPPAAAAGAAAAAGMPPQTPMPPMPEMPEMPPMPEPAQPQAAPAAPQATAPEAPSAPAVAEEPSAPPSIEPPPADETPAGPGDNA